MRLPIPHPLPRLTILASAAAIAVSLAVGATRRYRSHDLPIPADRVVTGADTSAWMLGSEHAADFVRECGDDDARGLRLLEIRARESNIRSRVGSSAADAYIDGFEYSLRQLSDSLASVILDY